MNTANERKLAKRATELGNSAAPAAFPQLAELAASKSPLVRRLAASAIGKLAGIILQRHAQVAGESAQSDNP